MSHKKRIPKSLEQKILDLDAHLFLLRTHLHNLRNSASHLKVIAAELRTLICQSSGTEGLLWRLVQELNVDDRINLHLPGNLNQADSLSRDLHFLIVPIRRAGKGDPRIEPDLYSLREVIKEGESLVVMGKPLTHQNLIKAIAEQMGTAHEDDGLSPALVELSSILINGVEPFVEVLATDAELTLEIGERVLEAAESKSLPSRGKHCHDYGNLSIVLRLQRKQYLASRVKLFCFRSYVASVTIQGIAAPTGIIFQVEKRGHTCAEFLAPYPPNSALVEDIVAVFSYSSRVREVRTLTPTCVSSPVRCELGWIHAADLHLEGVSKNIKDMLEQRFLLSYERLLSPKDVAGIIELPPDAHGLWLSNEEIQTQGTFPV